MWKAIVIHKIKGRVWQSAGITILPGQYDKRSTALQAAKAARAPAGVDFKDIAATYDMERITPEYFR